MAISVLTLSIFVTMIGTKSINNIKSSKYSCRSCHTPFQIVSCILSIMLIILVIIVGTDEYFLIAIVTCIIGLIWLCLLLALWFSKEYINFGCYRYDPCLRCLVNIKQVQFNELELYSNDFDLTKYVEHDGDSFILNKITYNEEIDDNEYLFWHLRQTKCKCSLIGITIVYSILACAAPPLIVIVGM